MNQINKMKLSLVSALLLLLAGMSANAQLNGVYTVYGTSPNFATLQDAANALAAGVSGPVTFKIRPGTWSSSTTSIAILGSISGASATNTVTFEAENGSAATTVITNTGSSSSSTANHIFYFNDAQYVTVRNLTLTRTDATYACAVRFAGSAQYNTVENCIMNGGGTSSSSSCYRVYGTSLASAHHNAIKNNSIDGGYYGIYWRGSGSSSSSLTADNEISGNTLTNIYYYGIYNYYTSNHKVLNNTITSKNTGSFYGIYSYYADNAFNFSGNTITRSGVYSYSYYPFYFNYGDGTSSNRGTISGNTITINSSTSSYGMYIYNCNYYTVSNNKITLTGSGTKYPLYNYNYNYSTSYNYGKDCYIEGNEFTATPTSGSVYLYAHYFYQNNPKFNNNKVTISGTSGSQYLYLGYYYQHNAEISGNTISMTGTSGSKYIYANYYYGDGGFEYNNNDITINTTYGSVNLYAGYYTYYNYDVLHFNNNKIKVTASSSATIYNYMGYYNPNSSATGNEIKGNEITLTTNGSYLMNYMGYYFDGLDLSDNTVYAKSNYYTYGIYSYGKSNGSNPWKVKNNKVTAIGGSGYVYGIYNYYAYNAEVANNVIYAKGSYYCYGYQGGYNYGGGNFYNNTIHTEGTGNHYAFYCYETSSSQSATLRNNVFSRSAGGSGYLMYGYQPQYYDMDYNNYWANGGTMLYWGGVGTSYSSITAMRAAMNQNMNSLSYDPGFVSATGTNPDLHPDPSNPNSWSLNGRGVQLAGNSTDINGNARAVTTITGVPDIGAYEFTPTATPPDCKMTPAAPVASGTQVVTFGEDTVAVLKWGTALPTGFAVKQYTGTNPPGITTINPTQMFFYADFRGTGTNLDYEQDLYFKDPWLGTIASKSALRLAEKVGSSAWSGYSPTLSGANVLRDFIHTPSVQNVGALFTGIDVSDNASADAIVEPTPPFCPGTYTVKLRIKNNGNNVINSLKIAWQENGGTASVINYNTPININGSSQGNEATITLGSVTFGSSAVNIKAWTYLPNNVQDPIPGDDTLDKDYFAALSGTYTVGGTTPDFPTVVAAADALKKYGTCGDVIFDIRPGTYTGQVVIDDPVPVTTAGHVTFRSENGVASSVTITYSTSNYNDPVLKLNAADMITIENLTIVAPPANYGQCIALYGDADADSILGCTLTCNATVITTYNSPLFAYNSYTNFTGDNLVIRDNTMRGGYMGCVVYNPSYTNGLVIDNNDISANVYCLYILYSKGLQCTNNTLTGASTYNTNYGIMAQYPQQSPLISGNKITNVYYSCIYLYQPQGNSSSDRGRLINNSCISKNNYTSYYPLMYYYGSNMEIMNNTFINNGNSSNYYAANMYLSSYSNNKIYNNVFANMAGGAALGISYVSGYNNLLDYNNLYTTSTSKFTDNSPATSSLAAWRTATQQDLHSVSYDPAITSATDPAPDPTNPACWSLNGHAVQVTGNTKDINGNARIDDIVNGVPDIGAYEIIPEVAPPAATATPASADPGDTQIFTFAGNEVGRIKWGLTAPSAPVTVRQYSGEKANGVAAAASPSGSMYFHTDVTASGNATTFDFDFNLDYMSIWLGDIATEANLRLAHRVTGYPWMVYSGTLSSVNTTTKNIDAAQLNRFGSFTALENNSVPSAFVRPQSSVVICIGNSVVLNAEPQGGDYYKWYRNSVAIPGAEGPAATSYSASQPGDYSVAITFSGKTVESVPVTVSTIAAPNALVSANGPLTYCAGNGLTLDAGNANGVKYQWQLNGNDIPGATNSTYPVNQAGNYTVVVTNIGCSSTSVQTPVSSGPLTVELGNDTSYCEIKNVWMKLDAGYPGAKYHWNTGDTSKVIEVKQGGKYWVQVNGGPNCIGTDTINVTIDPLPKANGISFVQNGNTYQFFPSGPVGAVGFLWIFSDGSTSTQNNPTKIVDGDLYVRLVMFNACGSDTVQLGWPLTVQSTVNEQSVNVYPNPAKDKVTISIDGAELQSVEVLNSVGSVVYRADVTGTQHSVDVSVMANGHYMLRAATTNGIVNRQFDILR